MIVVYGLCISRLQQLHFETAMVLAEYMERKMMESQAPSAFHTMAGLAVSEQASESSHMTEA